MPNGLKAMKSKWFWLKTQTDGSGLCEKILSKCLTYHNP